MTVRTHAQALPPYPQGWFVAARADELAPGAVITRPFMGGEVVLYRTRSGEAHAVDPYCPHLGAHLGKSGTVDGEELRCSFHGFCFDAEGACTRTGYGKRIPPRARLHKWALVERHGFLLLHHGAEGADDPGPDDAIPDLDMSGFTPMRHRAWTLRAHPQETTENSVDVGHFSLVHGYRAVTQLEPLHVEGPYLCARYAFERRLGLGNLTVESEITVHVHGLGYSRVEVVMPRLGVETRQFVLNTPVGEERSVLRIALAVRQTRRGGLRLFPLRLLAAAAMMGFAHDISQDFELWRHKIHVASPCLAEGDGPIGVYRRWARQFYVTGARARSIALPTSAA